MFKLFRKELEWGGTKLVMETGKVARQADGAVMVSLGETKVLCTAVAAQSPKPGQDFFPLTVNYQEKAFAAGKIPGGFFKREGRPSENETLVCRLIDRPIRPLFPKSFKCETQVICTVLAHDMENNPDIAAMIGASAALTLSGVPFFGPIAAARIGWIDGSYVLNPSVDQMDESELDLVMAGTHEGVLMVESEAKELSEDIMLGAVNFGHQAIKPVIDAIIELAESCAKEPRPLPEEPAEIADINKVLKGFAKGFEAAYKIADKTERQSALNEVRAEAKEALGDEYDAVLVGGLIKGMEADVVRGAILKTGVRIDGRDTKTVRQIVAEAGFLPRAHGSSLFTRGETQAMVVATLGTGQDEQIIDALLAKAGPALCCIITSRLIQLVRLAGLARRVVVRSAMANWHGVHCAPCCRQRKSSPILFVWFLKSPSQTDHHQWQPSVVAHWQ
jgi:polyribonucleotide nucleotidyltransferase